MQERLDPETIDAIVFDVIGTLVDEDATWVRVAGELAAEAGVGSTDDLLSGWVMHLKRLMDAVISGESDWQPHRQLVIDSATAAVRQAGGRATPRIVSLVSTLDRQYPAWPDVPNATSLLRGRRLVIGLSNGDLDSLAHLAHDNSISWDAALSTGTVRTFKPAPDAYRYAIDSLDLTPERTLFVAAHVWDLRAAAGHGFRTAYVARPGAEQPATTELFDYSVVHLAALAQCLT